MTPHLSAPSRRDVLKKLPLAAAVLAAHELLGQQVLTQPAGQAPLANESHEPRIRALRLLTAAPLAEMRAFYADNIGFPVGVESASEITFQIGATKLTFVSAKPGQIKGNAGRGNGEPMYHFAFNIPSDKIRAARDWQRERTPLVPPRPNIRDAEYPDDVWHFRHWNAHSVFFFDPAWNIVEYIARHDLNSKSRDVGKFDAKDILYASEIGFVTNRPDQKKTVAFMREKLGLSEYPRGAEPWAMGDERGLLLCLARLGDQWAEHTRTPVNWGVFPTECTIRGAKPSVHSVDAFPYIVRVE